MTSNGLVKIPAEVINNPYAYAMVKGSQMVTMTGDEKYNFLIDLLGITNFLGGWGTKSDVDIAALATFLQEDLETEFKLLTDDEVKNAFKFGAKGNYGENPGGLSVPTCLRWLRSYQADIKRQDAKKLLVRANDTPSVGSPWTQEQKRAYAQSSYERYLKTGPFIDHGNVVYNILAGECLMTFSDDQRAVFFTQACKRIHDQLQRFATMDEKRQNQKLIDDMIAGSMSPDAIKQADYEANRIALMYYFDLLKFQGIKEIAWL